MLRMWVVLCLSPGLDMGNAKRYLPQLLSVWCVSCTVVVLTCFVTCGCVCVCVCVCVWVLCMYRFCNVWVFQCVGVLTIVWVFW